MTLPYTKLTSTEGGWGLPTIGDVGNDVIGTFEDGSPKRRSDYSEAERQERGFASLTVEGTTGYTPGTASESLDPDDGVARTYPDKTAIPVTAAQVQAECARRLAVGFDYDFGGERGVHRFGTTERDLAGWDEVRALAAARVAETDTTPITIATDTGICQIAPDEWPQIDIAAADFRQPIWAYSFALQAQDPIPPDYTDDGYWPDE